MMTTDQKVYNTAVPVVANVLSESPAEAYRRLANALRAAWFEVLDDSPPDGPHVTRTLMPPFESEAGTVADL